MHVPQLRSGLLAAALLATGPLSAADLAAGRAKVEAVCAACHGANGVSVGDAIPNLAGQRVAYLENQLKAWKDGSRKNPLMNAIGSQLSNDEIANVAAYFASLPGAGNAPKSPLLANLATTHVAFPEGYRSSYKLYTTINFPDTKQVHHYFANPVALQAARNGQPVPDGAVMLAEVHAAKLDADKQPVTGADGFFVADKLLFYTAMARDAGWGNDIPDLLRNQNWNYAVFTTDEKLRPGVNQAECLACHKPLDKTSFLFTLNPLTTAAKSP